MAIRYAIASGNWSNPATWDGGTLPAAGDDVRSNGFTVTVDGNYTCLAISNRAETSPTVAAGGTFALANGSSVTATHPTNGFPLSGTSGHVVFTHNLSSGQSATLIGNHIHAAPANVGARLCNVTGAGTLNFIGNATGFDSAATAGISINVSGASAIVNVTGNCNTGTSNGQTSGFVVVGANNVTVNWSGNITASGTNGTTSAGGGIAVGTFNATTINVVGTLTGNNRSPAIAVAGNAGNTTITAVGQINAGSVFPGIIMANITSRLIASGPFVGHQNGVAPFLSPNVIWIGSPTGTYLSFATNDLLSIRTLYTADYTSALHMPNTNDVRLGVVYGPSDELTGTCAVPAANLVSAGALVDNTVGTAIITEAAFESILASYINPVKADTENIIADTSSIVTTVSSLDTNLSTVDSKLDDLILDVAALDTDLTIVDSKITIASKYSSNRTKIDNVAMTMTVYDDDGITPLKVFNLKNFAGNPSITEIAERLPQ